MEQKSYDVLKVGIDGIVGLMFDKFMDMSADEKPPERKMYLNDDNRLIFPSENIFSFFFGENPPGCAARFEKKAWKEYKKLGMSYVTISPEFIPIMRNGKQIRFNQFIDGYDKEAKIRVLHHKANIVKGKLVIPSPKIRPILEIPWEMNFEVTIWKNALVNVVKIQDWLIKGGIEVAIGTYRPRFGRFMAKFKN